MSAPWLMVLASLLFATMGVCVKFASAHYGSAEIVFYRGLVGALVIGVLTRWQGGSLRTRVPAMHFWRCLTGVASLCLWFYAIGKLPLATAVTLNYSSSVWMAMFLMGGAALLGTQRVEPRLIVTVLLGFAGVALILRPTIEHRQLWDGLVGLFSGMLSAAAYLQVTSLGRAGEPEYRVVFYFSVGAVIAGALLTTGLGWHAHTLAGFGLLLSTGLLAAAAQMLMTRAYRIGGTLVNASLQYLGIAFAFGYGVLLFGDRVTWMSVTGMALIVVAGVFAAQLRGKTVAVPSVLNE
jgi:S-adenosylmethionine uptake transporter